VDAGHPDPIQVHLGVRAAELAGTLEVCEGTMSRTQAARLSRRAINHGATGMTLDVDLAGFLASDHPTSRREVGCVRECLSRGGDHFGRSKPPKTSSTTAAA
jgi:hypothetical protein